MKMLYVLKEEVNEFFKISKGKINEILENNYKPLKENQTSKQLTEINKSIQELKIEIEASKKMQAEGILEIKTR